MGIENCPWLILSFGKVIWRWLTLKHDVTLKSEAKSDIFCHCGRILSAPVAFFFALRLAFKFIVSLPAFAWLSYMGVSTTRESGGGGGSFTHQDFEPWYLLWNFPSKKPIHAWRWRSEVRYLIFLLKIWPFPENSGPNSGTFQFLVGVGTLRPSSQETSDTCLVSPVALKPRIRHCCHMYLCLT